MREIKLEKDIARQILENNLKREYKTFSKYACFSNSAYRFGNERIPDKVNIRPPFFHDTDKIIHSLTYTRYIDKTQVFYLFENDHITHRVLHVQLVSKIARVIGRALMLNEDLIDAISLGHDLGHVPYGHDGESKLNELTLKAGNEYFCHNAQSVRALNHIDNKGKGLNLTLQVLDGILCHNGELMLPKYEPDYKKTPEQFLKEYHDCWTVKDSSKSIIAMTLEGCVMRISDVIAYIGRDLEDAITIGLIKRSEIPEKVRNIIGDNNGAIINNIILDLINNSFETNFIKLSDEIFEAIQSFSDFSYKAIYKNPKKTTQDVKIKNMFDTLFDKYYEDIESNRKETSISKFYLEQRNIDYLETSPTFRIVSDYIAGMTDNFFNKEFENFVIPKRFGYKV